MVAIVGARNDLMRYLRKCFLCSIELPKLGDAINEQRVALHSSLEKCLVQLANKFVIAVDDENGDEEGDLIMAASLASSQALAFMIRHGSGIVSVGMKQEDLERLSLPLMSTGSENEDPSAAAYTVTVDLKTEASTGVSASDRAKTILALSSPDSKPQDFRRPGHVFPLKYRNGGVLRRAGHTEASVDLVSLAGLRPISVLSAILDAEDGSMARLPALRKIAKENDTNHLNLGYHPIGLLFFISGYWGTFPVFQAIFTFPQERAMLTKERSSGMYRLSSYLMWRMVSDMPMLKNRRIPHVEKIKQ